MSEEKYNKMSKIISKYKKEKQEKDDFQK